MSKDGDFYLAHSLSSPAAQLSDFSDLYQKHSVRLNTAPQTSEVAELPVEDRSGGITCSQGSKLW